MYVKVIKGYRKSSQYYICQGVTIVTQFRDPDQRLAQPQAVVYLVTAHKLISCLIYS